MKPQSPVNRRISPKTDSPMIAKQTDSNAVQFPRQPQATLTGLPWLLMVACALVGNAVTASAAVKTWVPTAGGLWTTAANWSPSGAPAEGDDVTIPNNQ